MFLFPAAALAEEAGHAAQPLHACIRPVHPKAAALADPTVSKAALPPDHDFNSQVDRYKDCIWKFVVNERKAAQLHTSAAEAAIEDWYAFIRESLASGALKER
jgi:hypothetical protein